MNPILVALILSFGAFTPPPDTVRLPVLGVTIEVPPGTDWKVTPQRGGDGPDTDMLERTNPASPSLFVLIDRNPNAADCASVMDQMQGKGYSIVSSEDRAPSTWHPKMAQKDTVALACLDTKPGNIDAVTAASAPEEDLQMIRAILDSLAKNLGAGNPAPPPQPVETMKLPVLGVTIQMPAGAEWKVNTYTDDKGSKSDSLDRTSPASPALGLLLHNYPDSGSCASVMDAASGNGFTVSDGAGLVPSSWESRVGMKGSTTVACFNMSPGILTAAIEASDFTEESKQSIRALLQSVAAAYGK
jgi:hypothetical protein